MSALQEWEDEGGTELYYFDKLGFSQLSAVLYTWSPIGKPLEMTAYVHSHRRQDDDAATLLRHTDAPKPGGALSNARESPR